MRFFLPVMLMGCYTLESYWEDVAEVHCQCLEPSLKDTCVADQMAAMEESGLLEACGDEPPPATWREMVKWRQEFTAECDLSEATPPGADQALPEACD